MRVDPRNVEWTEPEYLEAALEDIIDVLGDAARGRPNAKAHVYTWFFEHRARRKTLRITVERIA